MRKEEVYLDLSKLSISEMKDLAISFIYSAELVYPCLLKDLINGVKTKTVMHFCNHDKDWERLSKNSLNKSKKEINLIEFKELLNSNPYPQFPNEKKRLFEELSECFK